MRTKEKKLARVLRQRGCSVNIIAKQIGCSKSSVSKWVRDIALTTEQIEQLKSNQDRGRAKAANHPNSPKQVWHKIRNDIIRATSHDISSTCSLYMLKVVGTALYWAEGYKLARNIVYFSNSDPTMISLMMQFFRSVCKVPESKFRGAVHIHPHLNKEKARRFWSRVSSIPLKQFHKTHISVSKASRNKRDTLPLGTFGITISDVRIQSKIKGWIKGVRRWASSSVG